MADPNEDLTCDALLAAIDRDVSHESAGLTGAARVAERKVILRYLIKSVYGYPVCDVRTKVLALVSDIRRQRHHTEPGS
jgi:hypothetical protein